MLKRARCKPFYLGAHDKPASALILTTTARQSASMLDVATLIMLERINERIK